MMRMSNKWLTAAIVLAVFLMVFSMDLRAEERNTASSPPVVTSVEGSVKIIGKSGPAWRTARVGTLLRSGDRVKTGPKSISEIRFPSGKIRLYENSVLIVPDIRGRGGDRDIRRVVVRDGSAVFDINPQGVRRKFEFRTRNVQGGVKGTRFAVGYRDGESFLHGLPPQPPIMLNRIYICDEEEVSAFTQRLDFMRLLLDSREVPADELVVSCLRLAARARPEAARRDFLLDSGRELARLMGADLVRLEALLGRLGH